MNLKIDLDWQLLLEDEFNARYFNYLLKKISYEYNQYLCYPRFNNIFSAFNNCPINLLKVVIIGQDPYHGYNEANGLCFSVNDNIPIPPSLKNIFKEIYSNKKHFFPISGNLINWAKQGVLLLNSILTVRSGKPKSHQNIGWEIFTDAVIKKISEKKNIVFLLWGEFAKKKERLINKKNNYVLNSSHPSPFSAHLGFLGCNHFVMTNNFLKKNSISPIKW